MLYRSLRSMLMSCLSVRCDATTSALQQQVRGLVVLTPYILKILFQESIPIKLSKLPSKKRVARSVLKLLQAAIPHIVTPHKKIAVEINFPVGSLTRSRAPRGCMTSCAM